ncbi:hypothetical protein PN498_13415 [Oscillatoria sp. CS-180]|uniref:hypothetical protein n=1 Tax=Oscillatoria sp. CS-180 TaxID=3021720 RepID=UPI00232E58AF|nr:hypothetical protein [Oscillatoria sp. CS-180]MDB9526993.1 hypothetical protein [Oscillatoria sp. CS-180]
MSQSKIPPHVRRYCDRCGYQEPFDQEGRWWAYPVAAVIPVPVPSPMPLKTGTFIRLVKIS